VEGSGKMPAATMGKNFYEQYWETRGKSGARPRYDIFAEWIEPGSKVLEIGCGDGYFGEMLVQKRQVDYTGCDISQAALDIAAQRGLNTRRLPIDDRIDYPDASFDYVLMSEFIEHIAASEEVLTDAMRVARKGVMVSIPNTAFWRFRLDLLFGNFPKQWILDPKEHLRFWSVTDFQRTIEGLGFRMARMKSSNGTRVGKDLWPNMFGLQICFYVTKK
jgi:methionine biosynthesis protein MetW